MSEMQTEIISDAELFVPINTSNMSKLIPPGEDIIYSSMAKQRWSHGRAHMTKESHFLATKKGFVMDFIYDYNIKMGNRLTMHTEERYIPWYKINYMTRRAGKVVPPFLHIVKGLNMVNFYREKGYESKERYAERSKRVLRTFIPLILESKKVRLAFLETHRDDKDIYKKKSKETNKNDKTFREIQKQIL